MQSNQQMLGFLLNNDEVLIVKVELSLKGSNFIWLYTDELLLNNDEVLIIQ
jgi:hypothetical protein